MEATKDLAVSIAFKKRSQAVTERNRFPRIAVNVVPVTGELGGGRYYVVIADSPAEQQKWFTACHLVWSVKLAAKLAQEQELPAGNLWEPPIARQILADVLADEWHDRDAVEAAWRLQLDLQTA